MSVEVDPFEDKVEEFGRVYGIMRSQGGLDAINMIFNSLFLSTLETRKRLPAELTIVFCINYGEETHFARECPSKFINRSRMIHPAVADSAPQEAKARWRRWYKRPCQWA